MPALTAASARALHARLELGYSVLDEYGYEVPVAEERRKPPRTPPPSWQELLERYAGDVEAPLIGAQDVPVSTPERVRAAREREAEAERARLDADREAALRAVGERLRLRQAERERLVCYPHDPMAQPDGSDVAATQACQAARAYRDCELRLDRALCPRARLEAAYDGAQARLGAGGVPAEYTDRILAARPFHRVGGERVAPVALEPRPALAVVRAWLSGTPDLIVTADGKLAPFAPHERLLVLAGEKRCGKSLAAAYAVAELGGTWTSAARLVGRRESAFDLDEYAGPDLLALDELGMEPLSDSGRARIFAVVAERHARRRRTVVTTNLRRSIGVPAHTFTGRYDERLDRRLTEGGRWIALAEWRS